MRTPSNRRPRRGFTLVELLVACALTVLIMAVLATAFQTGLSTFSHLKSTVGLSEQLRAAQAIIQRDLEATHLETSDGVALKVSDPRITSVVAGTAPALAPGAGFKGYLEVVQGGNIGTAGFVKEGTEDGVDSHRATDHAVMFTTQLRGDSPREVFVGLAPSQLNGQSLTDYVPANSTFNQPTGPGGPLGSTVATAWAEVALFLAPTSVMTIDDGVTAGTQLKLYSLIRTQRVLAPSRVPLPVPAAPGATLTPKDWWDTFPETSISTRPKFVPGPMPMSPPVLVPDANINDASSVTARDNRSYIVFTPAPFLGPPTFILQAAKGATQGTDILVTNVVSMQIRVMDSSGKYVDQLPGGPNGNGLDTSSPRLNGQMRAIQIKLRVYDTKNHLTRQTTMSFDL